MFDCIAPRQYRAFKGITDGETTRAGLFALLSAHDYSFASYDFWSDLTAAFLDNYLNVFLKSSWLADFVARGIDYDNNTGIWSVNDKMDLAELYGAFMGKFTETEAAYNVMTQQNLNIVSFNDVDQNVYGAKTTTRDYGKVEIDITNGSQTITDVFGQALTTNVYANRTDTLGEKTDTDTKTVSAFNSSDWENANKTTSVSGQQQNTRGGGTDTSTAGEHTDTHTNGQQQNNQTTKARQDTEGIATYTDTLTHTRHIVLSPDKYFEIQKEMADYNLYRSVADAVIETVTKGVW